MAALEQFRTPSPYWRIGFGAAVLIVVIALAITVAVGVFHSVPASPERIAETPSGGTALGARLHVDVVGAVAVPGLYVLDPGSRVVDAIAAAGGFGEGAARGAVNLARVLSDGEQLVVPVAGAQPSAATDSRIDINTATAAELESLPRIGSALAQRIVTWRTEKGRFANIEELTQVSGIGAKLMDEIRPLVRVA